MIRCGPPRHLDDGFCLAGCCAAIYVYRYMCSLSLSLSVCLACSRAGSHWCNAGALRALAARSREASARGCAYARDAPRRNTKAAGRNVYGPAVQDRDGGKTRVILHAARPARRDGWPRCDTMAPLLPSSLYVFPSSCTYVYIVLLLLLLLRLIQRLPRKSTDNCPGPDNSSRELSHRLDVIRGVYDAKQHLTLARVHLRWDNREISRSAM